MAPRAKQLPFWEWSAPKDSFESPWLLHQLWKHQIKQTSKSYVRPSRTSTSPQKPASFIFQPCIFSSCSHSGKTGHFMELIPGIHQHSVRQHGSQIFLCQKYTGQEKEKREKKGKRTYWWSTVLDRPKKNNSKRGKWWYYAIIQMLWSCRFHIFKLFIQRGNKQHVIPLPPYMQSTFLRWISLCTGEFYHQCLPLFSLFAAWILRLKHQQGNSIRMFCVHSILGTYNWIFLYSVPSSN